MGFCPNVPTPLVTPKSATIEELLFKLKSNILLTKVFFQETNGEILCVMNSPPPLLFTRKLLF